MHVRNIVSSFCLLLVLSLFFFPFSLSAQNAAVTVTVDANSSRRAINPNIYGVAHATTAQLNDLNSPLNRNGGNNTTRYNWQLNADNRGQRLVFRKHRASRAPSPASVAIRSLPTRKAANAQAMLTIPMIDWVAKLGANRSKLASFSIAKYGAQTGNDWQWFPDAGNGIRTSGQYVTGNDPNDANVPSNSTFQQGWAQHLVNRWGTNGEWRSALLHSRQRAEHLALHPSRRSSDRRDDG